MEKILQKIPRYETENSRAIPLSRKKMYCFATLNICHEVLLKTSNIKIKMSIAGLSLTLMPIEDIVR